MTDLKHHWCCRLPRCPNPKILGTLWELNYAENNNYKLTQSLSIIIFGHLLFITQTQDLYFACRVCFYLDEESVDHKEWRHHRIVQLLHLDHLIIFLLSMVIFWLIWLYFGCLDYILDVLIIFRSLVKRKNIPATASESQPKLYHSSAIRSRWRIPPWQNTEYKCNFINTQENGGNNIKI